MSDMLWHGGAAQKDHKKIRRRGQGRWTSIVRSCAGEGDGMPKSASPIWLAWEKRSSPLVRWRAAAYRAEKMMVTRMPQVYGDNMRAVKSHAKSYRDFCWRNVQLSEVGDCDALYLH